MKNIFVENDLRELIERVDRLTPETMQLWGKMSVSQMLEHCTVSLKLALNEFKPEINEEYLKVGKLYKDRILKEDVFSRELPTSKEFIMKDEGNFENNKNTLIQYFNKYSKASQGIELKGIHPFLGELTMNEWARLIWIHTNHHLIQFGV